MNSHEGWNGTINLSEFEELESRSKNRKFKEELVTGSMAFMCKKATQREFH